MEVDAIQHKGRSCLKTGMSSYRFWIIGLLALLLVGGGLAIWNADRKSGRQETSAQKEAASGTGSRMIGRHASFIVTEGELKKWKLSANKAVYNETQTDAVLTDVQGEFYNRDGDAILRFTAPSGNYVNRNNAVELTGGVIVQSVGEAKGGVKGRLEAPHMVWNAKTDWVTADGGILLSFPEGKSVAQSCRFSLDFSKIALRGNVASTISP